MNKNEDEIAKLRERLLDTEEIAYKLENIINIFMPFAIENSPEGVVIAELISKQIKKLQDVVKF